MLKKHVLIWGLLHKFKFLLLLLAFSTYLYGDENPNFTDARDVTTGDGDGAHIDVSRMEPRLEDVLRHWDLIEREDGDDDECSDYLPQVSMPMWMVEDSLEMMPPLLKGIVCYLGNHKNDNTVASCHRFVLVGDPGVGKTTLARVIAEALEYEITFVHASNFFGKYRNHTAINIRNLFAEIKSKKSKQAIIIDELHKLFENHAFEPTDDAANATAFWNQLDEIERNYPHVLIIGTANTVKDMPDELKSRFRGKIIHIASPDTSKRIKTLRRIIENDETITVTKQDIPFIQGRMNHFSLRDIHMLLDTAKMLRFGQLEGEDERPLILKREHFVMAMKQLESEKKKGWYDRMKPTLKKAAVVIHTTAEIGMIVGAVASGVNLWRILSGRGS